MAIYDIHWQAPLVVGTSVSKGQCAMPNDNGQYVVATAANRALYGRASGVCLVAASSESPAPIAVTGIIPPDVTGLGTGSASWVRVDSYGLLERCTPSGSDDIVGYCRADGTLHASFGWLTSSIVNGSGTSLATDNGDTAQEVAQVSTTDATPTNIGSSISLASDTITTVDVVVQCIQAGAGKAKKFAIQRSFLNDGGVVSDGTQTDLLPAEVLPTGQSLGASVAITRTGTTAQPKVTGSVGLGLRWYLVSQAMHIAAAAGAAAPTVSSISPDSGSAAGGVAVTITGTNFVTGLAVTIGGSPCSSIVVVNATTITCNTPSTTSGAKDVVVTNPDAQSATLAGGYTASAANTPETIFGTDLVRWYNETYSAGVWTDDSSLAGHTSQATSGKRPTTTTAPSGGLMLRFDGTDDHLNLGGDVELFSTAFTIGFVFRAASDIPGSAVILGKYYSGTAYAVQGGTAGTVRAWVNSTSAPAQTDGDVCDNTCHTVIVTYDNSTTRIYVDNVLQATTQSVAGPISDVGEIVALGAAALSEATATDFAAFDIGQLVMADVTADTTQRGNLHTYLSDWMT